MNNIKYVEEEDERFVFLQRIYLQGLEKRYDALLTMYGEKQEEADELRLDLADVKTLYRAQVCTIQWSVCRE